MRGSRGRVSRGGGGWVERVAHTRDVDGGSAGYHQGGGMIRGFRKVDAQRGAHGDSDCVTTIFSKMIKYESNGLITS